MSPADGYFLELPLYMSHARTALFDSGKDVLVTLETAGRRVLIHSKRTATKGFVNETLDLAVRADRNELSIAARC